METIEELNQKYTDLCIVYGDHCLTMISAQEKKAAMEREFQTLNSKMAELVKQKGNKNEAHQG